MPWYERYERTAPIRVAGGIKARSKRGQMGESWWARRWQDALEHIMDSGRLSRGRTYARKGQVRWIEVDDAVVRAAVQGSRRRPYDVEIAVEPLSEAAWSAVLDALAERAVFSAALLAAEVPREIEAVFEAAGASLFPARSGELETDCSCPDWANPCKHIAAVYFLLGEAFDDDPLLLLRLRGLGRDAILSALRERRGGTAEPATEGMTDTAGAGGGPASADGGPAGAGGGPARVGGVGDAAADGSNHATETTGALPEDADTFWRAAAPLDDLDLTPHPAAVEAALLRQLGQPAWSEPDLLAALGPVYRAVGQKAARR